MGRRKKVDKKKFLSRIILLLILLVVIILLIKGIFKKGDNDSLRTSNLIVDNEDITESLKSDIYIDKDGILYMSIEDIKNVFDKDLYFEENTSKVITTYGTKVAAIDVKTNEVELNSAKLKLNSGIIDYGTTYYIPVSEMTNIYNIEVTTTEKSAVVSSLYKELNTVRTTKRLSVKEKSSIFSSTIQKLDEDKEVIFIGQAEKKGWVKILTYQGKIGYVRKNNVTEKSQKRADMNDNDFSNKEPDINNSIELTKKELTNETLQDFSSRKKVIENAISQAIKKEKYTIYINIDNLEVEESLITRFIQELEPRLKEIGGNVTTNSK